MPMLTGNGENPQFYRQWMVEDSKNGLCAKRLTKTKNSISLDFRFVDPENTGECAINLMCMNWDEPEHGPPTRRTALHMHMYVCVCLLNYLDRPLTINFKWAHSNILQGRRTVHIHHMPAYQQWEWRAAARLYNQQLGVKPSQIELLTPAI